MTDIEELQECMDVAMATLSLYAAKIETLQRAVWLLLERTGDEKINGLRFDDWFDKDYRERLQENLISIENTSATMAARLQSILDAADRKAGPPPQ